MEYKELEVVNIDKELFIHFKRHQVVTKCLRKIENQWYIKDVKFTEDWDAKNYSKLVTCLKRTITKGGVVFGVFIDGKLKGFSSVEVDFFGKNNEYLELSSIHVSEDMRSKGIGKELFQLSKTWAKQHGAYKLYISAHSSIESQSFYRAMGCVEALEYDERHDSVDPYDCQLECVL